MTEEWGLTPNFPLPLRVSLLSGRATWVLAGSVLVFHRREWGRELIFKQHRHPQYESAQ